MKKRILACCLNILVPMGPFIILLQSYKALHGKRKANIAIYAQSTISTVMISPFFLIRGRKDTRRIVAIWWALVILLFIIGNSDRK